VEVEGRSCRLAKGVRSEVAAKKRGKKGTELKKKRNLWGGGSLNDSLFIRVKRGLR